MKGKGGPEQVADADWWTQPAGRWRAKSDDEIKERGGGYYAVGDRGLRVAVLLQKGHVAPRDSVIPPHIHPARSRRAWRRA